VNVLTNVTALRAFGESSGGRKIILVIARLLVVQVGFVLVSVLPPIALQRAGLKMRALIADET
jgi:hypothetical protein